MTAYIHCACNLLELWALCRYKLGREDVVGEQGVPESGMSGSRCGLCLCVLAFYVVGLKLAIFYDLVGDSATVGRSQW